MCSQCSLYTSCVSPLMNVWTVELTFMKLGGFITAPEPISTAYLINSTNGLCICVCPLIFTKQRLGEKRYCGNEYIRSNRRISGCFVFFAVCFPSKESRKLVLSRTSGFILKQWDELFLVSPFKEMFHRSLKTFPFQLSLRTSSTTLSSLRADHCNWIYLIFIFNQTSQ
jgi:hypothetical protein